MDTRTLIALNDDRGRQQDALQGLTTVGGNDAELALLGSLRASLETLEIVYDDEEFWSRAQRAVAEHETLDLPAAIAGIEEALPTLLTLFGYQSPPTPPAEQLVRSMITALQATAQGSSPDLATEARLDLGSFLARIRPLTEEARFAIAPLAQAAEEMSWWQKLAILAGSTMVIESLGAGAALALGAGGVATVVTTGLTGGLSVLVTAGILGAFKLWKRRKSAKRAVEEVENRLDLLDLLPTIQAAIQLHIEALDSLERESNDPLSLLEIESHLSHLAALCRPYVIQNSNLDSVVRQMSIGGYPGPRSLVRRLRELYILSRRAQQELYGAASESLVREVVIEGHRAYSIDLGEETDVNGR